MKKNYELVEIKVISLDNEDVITASGGLGFATAGLQGFFANFDLGDLDIQGF